MNQVQRSLLAKLMATEDIAVEHANVQTAMFHPTERTLYLPIWNDVSKDVYDLLVGHEVSHALYTSTEDVVDICERIDADNVDVAKDFLNVIEDARIEKKIKRKYNGLRRSFRNGYTELLERDWFGTEGRLIDSYQFIDRINLHFKLGSLLDVPFSKDELPYLDRISYAETFDEVFDIAKELYERAKVEKEEEEEEIPPPSSDDGDDSGEDENDAPTNDDQESDETGYPEDDEGFEIEGDREQSVERSETQQEMENALNQLVNEQRDGVQYAKIPDVNSDSYIVGFDEWSARVIRKFNKSRKRFSNDCEPVDWVAEKLSEFKKFKTDNTRVVNYLVKEFEMKKNAQQHARALTSRTGVLDVNKIHSYKFNEDLFKKITVVPDGKNHGLVFFVDWSGSMQGSINATLKQLLNLVWFCRKVSIPFEVFAFSDNSYAFEGSVEYNYKEGDLMLGQIRLIQLVSSTMNTKRFNDACRTVFLLAEGLTEMYWEVDSCMKLSSTPLNEAIILSRDVIKKFQSANQLELVNAVFLTDGQSNGMDYVYDQHSSTGCQSFRTGSSYYSAENKRWESTKSVITDRDTKLTYEVSRRDDVTLSLLQSLADRFEINVIGFFVGTSAYDIKHVIQQQYGHSYDLNEKMKKLRKEKSLVIDDCKGYTEFYIIQGGKDLEVGDDGLKVADDVTKRVLTTAFKKQLKNKLGNRVILNRFIELVS